MSVKDLGGIQVGRRLILELSMYPPPRSCSRLRKQRAGPVLSFMSSMARERLTMALLVAYPSSHSTCSAILAPVTCQAPTTSCFGCAVQPLYLAPTSLPQCPTHQPNNMQCDTPHSSSSWYSDTSASSACQASPPSPCQRAYAVVNSPHSPQSRSTQTPS